MATLLNPRSGIYLHHIDTIHFLDLIRDIMLYVPKLCIQVSNFLILLLLYIKQIVKTTWKYRISTANEFPLRVRCSVVATISK